MNILGEIPSNGYNAARASLNPNDPDYLKKMAMIGGVEGQHELNASNTQPNADGGGGDGSQPFSADDENVIAGQNEKPMAKMPLTAKDAPAPKMDDMLGGAAPLPADVQTGMPNIAKPHEGVLSKIGHGLEKAGNVAGDVLAPSTMALIPGTQLYGERQKAIQFARGQEELKTRTEQEREQEEADYRRSMANIGQEKADTEKSKALSYKDHLDWTEQHGDEVNAMTQARDEATKAFQSGKIDQGQRALDQQLKHFEDMYKEAEQKYGIDNARNLLMGQGLQIRKQLADIAGASLQQKGAEAGVNAQKALTTIVSDHPILDFLGLGDIPELQSSVSKAVPAQAAIPPNTPPKKAPAAAGTPKVGDVKTFPNGKKGTWDGKGWVANGG